MFRQKKGQAAMEFLMTYGWAILAAIIVVGVLWYLIGNPGNLAGTTFQLSAPFSSGTGVNLSTTGIYIEFRNGAGDSINVTSVNVTNCGENTVETFVAVGSYYRNNVSCTLQSGNRFNNAVTVTYKVGQGTLLQQATGTVNGKVP